MKSPVNWLSAKNAVRLAHVIEDFWKQYGYVVSTEVAKIKGTELYQVRSNLVGGLPDGYAGRK